MKAIDVYNGSDGDLTKRYYEELQKRGPLGMIAMNLFRAQKCSARAKVYRGGIRGQGSYRGMAYERKEYAIEMLCAKLAADDGELGIIFGWKRDPNVILKGDEAWVLYVDLPVGQVSFHSPCRFAGPDYAGDWDGQYASGDRVLAFCDQVMQNAPEVIVKLPQTGPLIVAPSEECACIGVRGVIRVPTPKRGCGRCRGTGRVRRCAECDGAGIRDSKPCGACGANGYRPAGG